MSRQSISRDTYLSRHTGDYPDTIEVMGRTYRKKEDLRYGTNPSQTAAWFVPVDGPIPVGDIESLKSGKGGLSQTNLEDISNALSICKYFAGPCCACMKHVNPCGVATAVGAESLASVYIKARDCDPRAAFGCVAGFNVEVDVATAEAIMSSYVECVVAPAVSAEALAVFNDYKRVKRNKHIRVLKCGDVSALPKFQGDANAAVSIRVLADGSLVVADSLLTQLGGVDDLKPAQASRKDGTEVRSSVVATPQQLEDLLAAWYINIYVRSNGVVIVKNGGTLAVGTGEQDRVGAVEQAIWKFKEKYSGSESIDGAVMSSDGYFPFPDAVETAAKAGVAGIIAPPGSIKDADIVAVANDLGIALVHAPERIFSHH